ncbi:hypothetical protein CRE_31204 [Caenorhabditis remanei]|uniref:Uncharacterized protein n=1 Tax=Caenorhabditis remanei TaxID=31234 RepID=E3MLK0_CAERE|nr:hypothetical protein CRE_31204 [Caenorhabditis remanei]
MAIHGDKDDIEMAVMNSEHQPLLQPQLQRSENRAPIFKRLNGDQKLNLLIVLLITVMILIYTYHLCIFLKKVFGMSSQDYGSL